jgi:hypothetical protein
MFPRTLMDRRIRFLVAVATVMIAGLALEVFFFPHYAAPVTSLYLALVVQALRHLRVWQPGGRPTGLFLVRALPLVCLGGLAIWLIALGSGLSPGGAELLSPSHVGLERARILASLQDMEGQHLVIVRYGPTHDPLTQLEWVYNAADIARAKVVWAREMDSSDNGRLLDYYRNRRAWLVEPDREPMELQPYPAPGRER